MLTLIAGIMDWDYKQYPSGYFHVTWASPPCTEYSIAKQTGVRKIDEAKKIVLIILNRQRGSLNTPRVDL
jgi:site-specific DNA-cytosine methylase